MKKKIIFNSVLFFLPLLLIKPAYAYGGPGVAIGAIIVLCTVILAFLGSVFLVLAKFIKRTFLFLKNFISKRKPTKSKNKPKNLSN